MYTRDCLQAYVNFAYMLNNGEELSTKCVFKHVYSAATLMNAFHVCVSSLCCVFVSILLL